MLLLLDMIEVPLFFVKKNIIAAVICGRVVAIHKKNWNFFIAKIHFDFRQHLAVFYSKRKTKTKLKSILEYSNKWVSGKIRAMRNTLLTVRSQHTTQLIQNKMSFLLPNCSYIIISFAVIFLSVIFFYVSVSSFHKKKIIIFVSYLRRDKQPCIQFSEYK